MVERTAPQFIRIKNRIINVHEIKWAGIPQSEIETEAKRVQIEFVSGGWALLEEGVTIGDLQTALGY